MSGKCFPFQILRKTLSFSLLTKRVLLSSDHQVIIEMGGIGG
jgi:hypothetical protein